MKKRLLLVGFPKSGNTWLGYMLSYLLGAKYTDLHAANKFPTSQKWILRLINGELDHTSDYSEVNKTHNLPGKIPDLESYDNIIYISRDPRDVAVSYFFFQWFNLPIFLNKKYVFHIIHVPVVRFFIWKMTLLLTGYNWNMHSVSWYAQNIHLVRYEDLIANTYLELNMICEKLNLDQDKFILNNAIDNFTFNKLSGGRPSGKEDKYHFFRKGIVGDYLNYFDWFDLWVIKLFCKKTMKIFNYKLT
jgi:hypothetical protein